MATNPNLRPFNTLPADQLREISRKGGKASGAARRKRRAMAEAAAIEKLADTIKLHQEILMLCAASKTLAIATRGRRQRKPNRIRRKY